MTRSTRIRSVGIAAVAAITLSACGGGSSSDASAGGGSPAEGGDLTIARQADILSMDKTTTFDNSSIYVMEQIMEPLFTVSQDGTEVEPWLATEYTVSDDKLTYTIKLRDGVTFSNGDPDDGGGRQVLHRRGHQDRRRGLGLHQRGDRRPSRRPTTARSQSSSSTPGRRCWPTCRCSATAIIPKDYGGKTSEEFYTAPVGTGPFVWGEWKQGQYVKVEQEPRLLERAGPHLDSVTWTVVPDANTRKLQLQGGQIDIDEYPGLVELRLAEGRSPGITATAFPSTRIDYVAFNQQRAPFEDVHVRRAIAYALDREAMVKSVLYGNGQAADSLLSPGTPFYAKNPEAPTFDLDEGQAGAGPVLAAERVLHDHPDQRR